jgi:hypothetical protein
MLLPTALLIVFDRDVTQQGTKDGLCQDTIAKVYLLVTSLPYKERRICICIL